MAESFIKILRIKEMIATQKSFDCSSNSPHQRLKKCMESSMEIMDTDVRVERGFGNFSGMIFAKAMAILN